MKEKLLKAVVVFISVISMTCAIVFAILLSVGAKYGDKDSALTYGYERIMKNYAAEILNMAAEGNTVFYGYENMDCVVVKTTGRVLELDEIWSGNTIISINCWDKEELKYTTTLVGDGRYCQYDTNSLYNAINGVIVYGEEIDGNIVSNGEEEHIGDVENDAVCYTIAYDLSNRIIEGDLIYDWKTFVEGLYDNIVGIFIGFGVSLLIWALTLCKAIYLSIHSKNKKLKAIDCMPLEILLIAAIILEMLLGKLIWTFLLFNKWVEEIDIVILLMVIVAYMVIFSVVRRKRAGKLYKNTFLQRIARPLGKIKDDIYSHTSLLTKVVVALSVLTLIELVVIFCTIGELDNALICFVIYKVFEYVFVIYVAYQMWIIKKGGERVAAGNFEEEIAVEKLEGEFRAHGENINTIGEVVAEAVYNSIKSERMKTELITNVSHDIKTPLTSIINYVDLIKREDIENETVKEYVQVLDRQSARLKKLIEDLIEASKAATGNLEVNMEQCDVNVILSQALGEFSDKLEKNKLEVIVKQPDKAMAMADGRYLWRVFDNLINNICKYSMEGTRVYIDIENTDSGVEIVFKNLSKTALNISTDELMERFVRGDESRNTEGSGLGLSIALSLVELMHGTMELSIDGDLFKVTVELKGIEESGE